MEVIVMKSIIHTHQFVMYTIIYNSSTTPDPRALEVVVLCPDPTQLTQREGVWCHKPKSLV